MRARGLRAKDLGEKMGWSESLTSKILGRQMELKADELLKLMELFGYPLPPVEGAEESDAQVIARIAAGLDEDSRRALVVYLKLLPQKKP